jgi:hypothetical protein
MLMDGMFYLTLAEGEFYTDFGMTTSRFPLLAVMSSALLVFYKIQMRF